MPFPGCGRSQDVKLTSRGILTSPKSPRANPMFLPRAVAPTLHGRFFSGPAYMAICIKVRSYRVSFSFFYFSFFPFFLLLSCIAADIALAVSGGSALVYGYRCPC